MKRIKWLALIIAVISCLMFTISACENDKNDKPAENSSTILVAYFSCTGNTAKIAESIAEVTGAVMYEIIPTQPYSSADLNYNDSGSRVTLEQRDSSARPAINGSVDKMENYQVIYLGYPIWLGAAPKIICTFLESYDFPDKTIIPFCTSGGSDIGNSAIHLRSLAEGANWLDGRRFANETSKTEISEWIDWLGI